MFRTIFWFISFTVQLIFSLPKLLKANKFKKQNNIKERDNLAYKTANNWAKNLVNITGSNINVIGKENIPKDKSVLFVSNHQGNFDIPLILGYLDKPVGFIAKIETKKIPVIRKWMEHLNCIFMDRKDIRQSLRAINKGANTLKEGYSLAIFPEGTRSEDGSLGKFKKGSLKLALKSGVPIVPITISGSNNMMKKNSLLIKPANVKIVISEPIYLEEFTKNNNINELSDVIRNIISENLHKTASNN